VCVFADNLRAAGHIVHTPDLFDGRTFQSIDEGLAYIGEIGFDDIQRRGVRVADELPGGLAGFSFGALPSQKRPGARGALLFTLACRLVASGPWPEGVAVQIHGMDDDRSSPARATSTPLARSWRRSGMPNFSYTPVISTTSPTTRSCHMTRMQPHFSPPECFGSPPVSLPPSSTPWEASSRQAKLEAARIVWETRYSPQGDQRPVPVRERPTDSRGCVHRLARHARGRVVRADDAPTERGDLDDVDRFRS